MSFFPANTSIHSIILAAPSGVCETSILNKYALLEKYIRDQFQSYYGRLWRACFPKFKSALAIMSALVHFQRFTVFGFHE